jgi:hypothetical protein
MIEAQASYAAQAVAYVRRRELAWLDVLPEVQAAYNARVQNRLRGAVWSTGCRSWYLNDRGKNTTIWPGTTLSFRRRLREFRPEDYELRAAHASAKETRAAPLVDHAACE